MLSVPSDQHHISDVALQVEVKRTCIHVTTPVLDASDDLLNRRNCTDRAVAATVQSTAVVAILTTFYAVSSVCHLRGRPTISIPESPLLLVKLKRVVDRRTDEETD